MQNTLITSEKKQAAQQYIRAIRNKFKREYAEKYFAWCENNFEGDAPEMPLKNLSMMGHQAVRMQLTELLCH